MDEGREFYLADPVLAGCPVEPPDGPLAPMCAEERAYFARVADHYYGLRVRRRPLFEVAWAALRARFLDTSMMVSFPEHKQDEDWRSAEREALALLMRVTVCRCAHDVWLGLYADMQENLTPDLMRAAEKLRLPDVGGAVTAYLDRQFLSGRYVESTVEGEPVPLRWLLNTSPPEFFKYNPAAYYQTILGLNIRSRMYDMWRREESKKKREQALNEHLQAVLRSKSDVENDAFAKSESEIVALERMFDKLTKYLNGLRVNKKFVRMQIAEIRGRADADQRALMEKPGDRTGEALEAAALKIHQRAEAKVIIYEELIKDHEHFSQVLRSAKARARDELGEDAKITQYAMYKLHFACMDLFVLYCLDHNFPKAMLRYYLDHMRHSDHDAPRAKEVKARMEALLKDDD